jgi:hypothetical protein
MSAMDPELVVENGKTRIVSMATNLDISCGKAVTDQKVI